nr:translocation/assembly module TamB domain-containing protein [Pseudovibrio flavus]
MLIKRLFSFIFKGFVALVSLLGLVYVLVVGAGSFERGQELTGQLLSALIPDVTIERPRIDWALDVDVHKVSVSDVKGTWLELQGLDLDWSPIALFSGQVVVDKLSALSVRATRRPEPSAEKEPSGENKSSLEDFLIIPVDLKDAEISEIILDSPVLGAPALLRADAEARLTTKPEKISAKLNVSRLDEIEGFLAADLTFAPNSQLLDFDVEVFEAKGGLFDALTNAQNAPSVKFSLTGNGPVEDWNSQLSLALDGKETVSGQARFQKQDTNRLLTANLSGALAFLLPESLGELFEGQTALVAEVQLSDSFDVLEGTLNLSTNTFFAKANGNHDPASGRLLVNSTLETKLADGQTLTIPLENNEISLGRASATFHAAGPISEIDWEVKVDSLGVAAQGVSSESVTLSAKGQDANLTKDQGLVPFIVEGDVKGLSYQNADLQALPTSAQLLAGGRASIAQSALSLDRFALVAQDLAVRLENSTLSLADSRIEGSLTASKLDRFSKIAKRDFGGDVQAHFTVTGPLAEKQGRIETQVTAEGLKIGSKELDGLIDGDTKLVVAANIDASPPEIERATVTIERAQLVGPHARLSVQGNVNNGEADAGLSVELYDLNRIDPRLQGALTANLGVRGPVRAADVVLNASTSNLVLNGTAVPSLKVEGNAKADPKAPNGQLNLSGIMNERAFSVSAVLSSEGKSAEIGSLIAKVGENEASGSFTIADMSALPTGISGNLTINAPDLSQIAPLLLTEAEGAITGSVKLDDNSGSILADIDLRASDVKVADLGVESIAAQINLEDIFAKPRLDGEVLVSALKAGEFVVNTVNFNANTSGDTIAFEGKAVLAQDDQFVALNGELATLDDGGFTLTLNELDGSYDGIDTKLNQPARITVGSGQQAIEALVLELGDGRLTVSGSAGENLDVKADLASIPVSLANAFVPDLALAGQFNGTATVTGPSSNPQAQWSIQASGLNAAPLRQQDIQAVSIESTGSFANNTVSQQTTLSNPAGLDVRSKGTITLGSPVSMDVDVDGRVPMSVLNGPLIRSRVSATGAINLDGKVSGRLPLPQISFVAAPDNLEITQLTSDLVLKNFTGRITSDGKAIKLESLGAEFLAGGTLNANGQVDLGDGLPADITLTIDKGRYINGDLVNALINAALELKGQLGGNGAPATISGEVTIERADIGIPTSLGTSINPVGVKHVNAPIPVAKQAQELARDEGRGSSAQAENQKQSKPIALDITMNAPGQIFVRGRGLNAEVGGALTVKGTTNDIETVGQFSLRRGRFDILSKRLTFSQGDVTFAGTFIPFLDFAAQTTTSEAEVTISITGPADEPVITFSSVPDLPQDEILAQLLFGQSSTDLSPLQLAQLASAVATLSGGGTDGAFSALRNLLGLSDIDVSVDPEGNAELSAGTYINENIYLGVTQDTGDGSNRATVDIEITKNLRLRGEADSKGDTKAGFYFEREY